MTNLKKYLITFGAGLAVAFAIAYGNDIFNQTKLYNVFGILTDSFFVPGIMLVGIGGLLFVSNEGMFDSFVYGITSFADLFRQEKKNKHRTFYDYKESKKDRNISFNFLLISGLVFMVMTGIMYWLYTVNI